MYCYPFATVPIQRRNRTWPPDQSVLLLPTSRAPYPPSFVATGETQRHGCDLAWRGISEGVVKSREEKNRTAARRSSRRSSCRSPGPATGIDQRRHRWRIGGRSSRTWASYPLDLVYLVLTTPYLEPFCSRRFLLFICYCTSSNFGSVLDALVLQIRIRFRVCYGS
jgi:hypothetical protein